MRLDLARRLRNLVVRPGMLLGLPFRREVRQLDVRIRDDGLLDVLVDRGAALLVAPLDLHRHLGAARRLPVDLLLLQNQRLVLLGVDLDLEEMGGRSGAGARDDLDGLAGRELSVHAGRGDADALLAAAHPEPMELRSVEELRENRRNLLPDDAGAVVGDRDPEPGGLARGRRRSSVGHRLKLDDHVGEDPGLFARVERVIDGLLDAGQQGLSRIVEAEEMAVLGEELRHGDLPLARSHLDGRNGRLGRCGGSRSAGLRTTRLTATLGQWLARWFAYTPHTNKIRGWDSSFPASVLWTMVPRFGRRRHPIAGLKPPEGPGPPARPARLPGSPPESRVKHALGDRAGNRVPLPPVLEPVLLKCDIAAPFEQAKCQARALQICGFSLRLSVAMPEFGRAETGTTTLPWRR